MVAGGMLVGITYFIKFRFVTAAAALLFLHPTFTTAVSFAAIEFNSGLLTHAIVYLHGNAGRYPEVQKSQYEYNKFFHER